MNNKIQNLEELFKTLPLDRFAFAKLLDISTATFIEMMNPNNHSEQFSELHLKKTLVLLENIAVVLNSYLLKENHHILDPDEKDLIDEFLS